MSSLPMGDMTLKDFWELASSYDAGCARFELKKADGTVYGFVQAVVGESESAEMLKAIEGVEAAWDEDARHLTKP